MSKNNKKFNVKDDDEFGKLVTKFLDMGAINNCCLVVI